jgi:hypothetical protein
MFQLLKIFFSRTTVPRKFKFTLKLPDLEQNQVVKVMDRGKEAQQGNVCLFIVLCPAQEFATDMEKQPLPEKGWRIQAYTQISGLLSRVSCHTCCDMWRLVFFPVSSDEPCTTHKGMRRTHSNLKPDGPHSVA